MNDKNINQKKEMTKTSSQEIVVLIEKKMLFFQDVIQNTILHVQKNKILEIIGVSEVNSCINTLFDLSRKIKEISETVIKQNTEQVINILQIVNNDLSSLFKLFGTDSFEDLLWICFGNNSVNTYAISDMDKHKFELLKKYFHPTSYKLLGVKKQEGEKQIKFDDLIFNEKSKNLDTADIGIKIKPFHLKVYGIQIVVHNPQNKKSLIITGTVDDIMIEILNNKFINLKNKSIKEKIEYERFGTPSSNCQSCFFSSFFILFSTTNVFYFLIYLFLSFYVIYQEIQNNISYYYFLPPEYFLMFSSI